MSNYKYGGYGRYMEEMIRLEQFGLSKQFRKRRLESASRINNNGRGKNGINGTGDSGTREENGNRRTGRRDDS